MSAQEQASQVAWVDNELNELTKWYQSHVDGVRRDAAECAVELRVALHIEAVNMQEVDGQIVNIGDLDALTDTEPRRAPRRGARGCAARSGRRPSPARRSRGPPRCGRGRR